MNGLRTFAVSPSFASEADDSFDHIHRALESGREEANLQAYRFPKFFYTGLLLSKTQEEHFLK